MSEEQVYCNGIDAFKDFSDDHQTLSRLVKGYQYEMKVQDLLLRNNISFTGNPKSFEDWKKTIGRGVDITIQINGKTIEIECKYLQSKAYPSYVLRDYVTRFSSKSSLKITVTNNKWLLTYNAREVLKQFHSRLFNDYELVWYLVKLLRFKGNKKIFLNKALNNESLTCKVSSDMQKTFSTGNFKVKASFELGNKAENCGLHRSENVDSEANNSETVKIPETIDIDIASFENWKLECEMCANKRECPLYNKYIDVLNEWKNLKQKYNKQQMKLFQRPSTVRRELELKLGLMRYDFGTLHKQVFEEIFKCIRKRFNHKMNLCTNQIFKGG